jgi:hypothetical protein
MGTIDRQSVDALACRMYANQSNGITMTKQTTKPSAAIVYDVQTANHAADSVNGDLLLLEDAKRFTGGIASKDWRVSFMVGTIAAIAKKPMTYACDIIGKAAPDSAGKPKRSAAEQKLYNAAKMRLSRFCKTHSIQPVNKARGKPKSKADNVEKDNTPKAVNAKGADSFLRQQAAMLQAYGEKNRPMLSTAMLHAIGEFVEAINTIPNQD